MRPPASGMWRLEQNDESGVADAERQSILTRFAEHVSASTSRDPSWNHRHKFIDQLFIEVL